MSKPIITVENLSKRYILSHQGERENYVALRDVITNKTKNLFNGFNKKRQFEQDQHLKNYKEEFWALKDVSFEVNQGDTIGIIGRNGAGKSTLLKILSRITEPTEGKITINGRVASLLEVGTGFHPELTGRENIYLNGAILGMTRAEIKSKFDEIVDFAEIEKFLDTPVKRYSSGMYVRLAFAVAAHLNPEILIVDEVLAVGDAQFQKKCLGKMGDVSKQEGKTVLFVSHNMGAIRSLCKRCILLNQGKVVKDSNPDEAINNYMTVSIDKDDHAKVDLSSFVRSGGSQRAILEAWVEDSSGRVVRGFNMGESIKICYRFKADRVLSNPGYIMNIANIYGISVASFPSRMITNKRYENTCEGVAEFSFERFPLLPGTYVVGFALTEEPVHNVDKLVNALSFQIEPYDLYNTGKLFEQGHGLLFLNGTISCRMT